MKTKFLPAALLVVCLVALLLTPWRLTLNRNGYAVSQIAFAPLWAPPDKTLTMDTFAGNSTWHYQPSIAWDVLSAVLVLGLGACIGAKSLVNK